ncbi:MAG: aerobic carbon-monoxide dehydrogenase medium subunit [Alphaproteobacteria bacterium]|nr:aerobic carbon-monoxide dehydrogenase medium subunit [Alphaproteobacteria bacterium]
MYQFEYHRPKSLDEVTALLARCENPKILAGGMTLLATMKQRLAAPSDLIDLQDIAGMTGISVDAKNVAIGAMTPHHDVATSRDVAGAIPALAFLAGRIGDPLVRHRGTIGGSIANNDPSADYPSACLALGATIVTNVREIAADDYFRGMFETALKENEIITRIIFPIPQRAAYQKFPNPASRYAMVGVFVVKGANGVRVAVTGAGPGVFRMTAMEAALAKNFTSAALEGIAAPAEEMLQDMHASSEYRAALIGVMAKRAVAAMLA